MKRNYIFALLLILLALGERLWFDLGNNIELITLVSFVTAFYISPRWSWLMGLLSIVVSDVVLGNTSIMLFTWSAYVGIGIIASRSNQWSKKGLNTTMAATSGGIISSLWFYAWTNFGVWALDRWGMYSNDVGGLVKSYVMGVPFLKTHLASNIVILLSVFLIIEISQIILQKYKTLPVRKLALKHSGIR